MKKLFAVGAIFCCTSSAANALTFVNNTNERVRFTIKSLELEKEEEIILEANSKREEKQIGKIHRAHHCSKGRNDTWVITVANSSSLISCGQISPKQLPICRSEKDITVTFDAKCCKIMVLRTSL